MKLAPRFAPGIRAKVLLASSALLLIPWIGYAFVAQMERFLGEAQSRMLAENARAVATLVQERALITAPDRTEERGAFDITPDVAAVLEGMARAKLRIWIVDGAGNVVMRTGVLSAPAADPLAQAGRVQSPEVEAALSGYPTLRAQDERSATTRINGAAYPIVIGGETAGAALVEQTSESIDGIRTLALQRLLLATLAAFVCGALILVFYVTRLSNRLRSLRDEAESAIDSAGRVRALAAGSTSRDEIGDLSRSYSAVLKRLSQYTEYLENLARRLNHELRTPIAVVRSSLDNLRGETPGAAAVYLDRAEAGLDRLGAILSRMSEATRLEDIMGRAERETFDLSVVAAGCAEGYRLAYAPLEIRYRGPGAPVQLHGVPDLIAQMLDKLVENAAEYAAPGTPVEITLETGGRDAVLRVSNEGPPLPAEMQGRLFDSMVSVQTSQAFGVPHLGLGLYVVKLIAQFHRGSAAAVNRTDRPGVEVTVRLALDQIGV